MIHAVYDEASKNNKLNIIIYATISVGDYR
jgi:hypothetical protein